MCMPTQVEPTSFAGSPCHYSLKDCDEIKPQGTCIEACVVLNRGDVRADRCVVAEVQDSPCYRLSHNDCLTSSQGKNCCKRLPYANASQTAMNARGLQSKQQICLLELLGQLLPRQLLPLSAILALAQPSNLCGALMALNSGYLGYSRGSRYTPQPQPLHILQNRGLNKV